MGWFADRRSEREGDAYEGELARWADERDELTGMLALADDPDALRDHAEDVPLLLRRGEFPLAVLHGSRLVEPRRGRGRFRAGTQGFSFRVAKGITYRVGGTRGYHEQGEEELRAIDAGTVTITSRRVVFQGERQAREWVFSKVLGIQDDPTAPLSLIAVSNRQKVSGFTYDEASSATIRFRLALAAALSSDALADLRDDLGEQLAEHDATRPHPPPGYAGAHAAGGASPAAPAAAAAPTAPLSSTAPVSELPAGTPPPTAPAGWYADPAAPTRWRWWDGGAWTDHVHEN